MLWIPFAQIVYHKASETSIEKGHRIAMTFAIAAMAAEGETEILDAECVDISYPAFYQDLARLAR